MPTTTTLQTEINSGTMEQLRIGSCLACVYRVMDAHGKFGEHERRVAKGILQLQNCNVDSTHLQTMHYLIIFYLNAFNDIDWFSVLHTILLHTTLTTLISSHSLHSHMCARTHTHTHSHTPSSSFLHCKQVFLTYMYSSGTELHIIVLCICPMLIYIVS